MATANCKTSIDLPVPDMPNQFEILELENSQSVLQIKAIQVRPRDLKSCGMSPIFDESRPEWPGYHQSPGRGGYRAD